MTGNIEAHHCFLTTVHAAHLYDPVNGGRLLMMHGQSDQRLWEIGAPADEITWHPPGPKTTWQRRSEDETECGAAP